MQNHQQVTVKLVTYLSDDYDQLIQLRNEVLRIPLGLILAPEDIESEKADIFIGAFTENNHLVGCCVLTKTDDPHIIQLRQMGIDAEVRKMGIGAAILRFAEKWASEQQYQKIILHARKVAEAFYEKNGYSAFGEEFTEVGIPHSKMEKNISK